MTKVSFAIIKERKNPPDRRVVFSPKKLKEASTLFPDSNFIVESSDIRIFKDAAYASEGFKVKEDVSDADVMIGVKEVPMEMLVPHKKYFFFSHTIKLQPYNRKLLRAILDKKIELYDHETIVNDHGGRLIGFGRYAGLVGAYNGFRALGLRDGTFKLPKAESLDDLEALKVQLNKISLPNMKIVLSGSGKVAFGAKEILDHLNIQEVSVDNYLNDTFDKATYTIIDVLDYNKRKDGKEGDRYEFYDNPLPYVSDFMKFAKTSDMFIAGHFYGNDAPFLFTREDAKKSDFKIKLIADISCDIDGPVASTVKSSTIAEPFYGYHPNTEKVVPYNAKDAITVMAVDNLPCELPKDASEGFGDMFLEHVIPAFFNNDKDGILDRAKITTSEGTLADRFKYLQDFVDGRA